MTCIPSEITSAKQALIDLETRTAQVRALVDTEAANINAMLSGDWTAHHYAILSGAQADAVSGDAAVGVVVTVHSYAATGDGGGFTGIVQAVDNPLYPGGGRIKPVGWPYRAAAWGVLPTSTGAENCARLQQVVDFANGAPIHLPEGTLTFTASTLYNPTPATGVWSPGIRIEGAGSSTVIDNQVAGDYWLSLRTPSTLTPSQFYGNIGGYLRDFRIKSAAGCDGLYMTAAYQTTVERVWIDGGRDGIVIPCELGDNDGSNQLLFRHCRIENCTRWGFDAKSANGKNENSFIRFDHSFIQACGTNDNGQPVPTSGGMRWKGQILEITGGAFTLNQNVALFIPGEAGLAQTCRIDDTALENNPHRSLYCTGITKFKGSFQVYQNASFPGTVGVEFDGTADTVRNVEIENVVVRQNASGGVYTAFKLTGSNAETRSCRVRNTIWDVFPDSDADYKRFDGWQFDPVENHGAIQIQSATEALLKPRPGAAGITVPLRLRGSGSITGEWVTYQIPSGGLVMPPAEYSGLAVNSRPWVYLYDNNGVPALEADVSASPVIDSITGYQVKSLDATRTYVGRIVVDSVTAGELKTSGIGFLGALKLAGTGTGNISHLWSDANGDLRIKNLEPGFDTDGTIVGTQS